MISYPETQQYRDLIRSVRIYCSKKQNSENPILPTMKFTGTVKLHGSNAAIVYEKDADFRCQSRNRIITPTSDNAGFAAFTFPIANQFLHEKILPNNQTIAKLYNEGKTIVIFGEWCGGKIQSGVAISHLPLMFVIFKIQIVSHSSGDSAEASDGPNRVWLDPQHWLDLEWKEKSIYNIFKFKKFEVEIDFDNPAQAQNELVKITEEVESCCPVGAAFNSFGVGEGVVWTEWPRTAGQLSFKVKGEKHAVTRVKTLAPIDVEKMTNINEFIEFACTENRMKQGLDFLAEQNLTTEMKNFPVFIRWLNNDIIKEEKETMDKSHLNPKDVSAAVAKKGRNWFQQESIHP